MSESDLVLVVFAVGLALGFWLVRLVYWLKRRREDRIYLEIGRDYESRRAKAEAERY